MFPWLQEEKRRERALLEKQLEDDQRLQAQLAAKAAADKKHLIEFVAKDQVKTILVPSVLTFLTITVISFLEILDFPLKWYVKWFTTVLLFSEHFVLSRSHFLPVFLGSV